MKEIQITEENYWAYKSFYCANHGQYIMMSKKQNRKFIASSIIYTSLYALMMVVAAFLLSLTPFFNNAIIGAILSIVIGLPVVFGGFVATIASVKKAMLKEIKKEYPDVDFDVNIEVLKKELEKYEILSQIPKDIDKKQEEHLTKFDDNNFKEMSPEEKIELLEKEKKFWEQVKKKEELTEQKTELNEEQIQKKIGTIK